ESAGCPIRGFGIIQASTGALATLRNNPAPWRVPSVPRNLLKYADEQTVAAVAAVFRAIEDFALQSVDFTDWGVVAAPRFLGRLTIAGAIDRFDHQGAPGVSPLVIPYMSQHAISSTISLALQVHGPNLGAGGGPES